MHIIAHDGSIVDIGSGNRLFAAGEKILLEVNNVPSSFLTTLARYGTKQRAIDELRGIAMKLGAYKLPEGGENEFQ